VDWIVVFQDLVLLVEAKAKRTPAGVRAADYTTINVYQETLGKAFDQIDRTSQAIQDGVSEFNQIPRDRPVLGMVATLDPWYMANNLAREHLPSPDVPTIVGSVRGLEYLVGIGQRRSASEILLEISAPDDERRQWALDTALHGFAQQEDRNPILDASWKAQPLSQLATSRAAAAQSTAENASPGR
jgi:hypothetical protein